MEFMHDNVYVLGPFAFEFNGVEHSQRFVTKRVSFTTALHYMFYNMI